MQAVIQQALPRASKQVIQTLIRCPPVKLLFTLWLCFIVVAASQRTLPVLDDRTDYIC